MILRLLVGEKPHHDVFLYTVVHYSGRKDKLCGITSLEMPRVDSVEYMGWTQEASEEDQTRASKTPPGSMQLLLMVK